MMKLDLKKKVGTHKSTVSGVKKKRKPLGAHQAAKYILIVGIIIILIPCAALGVILISASKGTDKPAEGQRFKSDLTPEITSEMIDKIETKINAINGVETTEVSLSTGQLSVYVDVDDSYVSDNIKEITEDVYEAVDSVASVSTYFTNTSSKRMYDLAINVYNYLEEDGTGFICWNAQKNAQMEEVKYTEISKAMDEDLAKELRGETTEEE